MNRYLMGYLITLGYLLLVVLISLGTGYFLRKNESVGKNMKIEVPRKVVHIGAGLGFIILKLFFEGSYHSIIITSSFILIAIASILKDTIHIQREEKDFGLLMYTCSMAGMATISYFFPETFDAFGIAIFCLALGDGSAALIGRAIGRHKWPFMKNKSIEGSLGGFLVAVAAILGIVFGFNMAINPIEVIIVAFVAMTIELFADKWDNLVIPFASFALSSLFIIF